MKLVPTEAAVGMVLGHDMTQIIPGQFKGPKFRKGQIVRAEDVAVLLSMGKEHIYVMEVPSDMVHEAEAARRIARAAAGEGITFTEPKEGKVELKAARRGLMRLDLGRLERINAIGDVQMACRRDCSVVNPGDTLAGTRVTPLLVAEAQVAAAEAIGGEGPTVVVKPFRPRLSAVIVTGSEVFKGRIQDKFGPVVAEKLAAYDCPVVYMEKSLDDREQIADKIAGAVAAGAEIICCTGGMSVDPDDATPGGIKLSGAELVTYGAPVLPGSMFMLAYLGDRAVMGLPGAVMYDPFTLFDLVLPRVVAGERLTKREFVVMGHGGLLKV